MRKYAMVTYDTANIEQLPRRTHAEASLPYHIYDWDAHPSLHVARTRPSVELSHECGVTHVTHVCTYHTHITGVRAWWYGRYHHTITTSTIPPYLTFHSLSKSTGGINR